MAEVVLTTGDIIMLRGGQVHARQMTEDQEFTYVGVQSIVAEEAFRWNFEVIQLLETHFNYFDLDIGEWMPLYEENICRIFDRIQVDAIATTLRLFYGEDRNSCKGKLIHYSYLNTYNGYYDIQYAYCKFIYIFYILASYVGK